MNKKDYLKIVDNDTPKENKWKNASLAFLVGGLIGMFGEGIRLFLISVTKITSENAISIILLLIIFISCLFTCLGFFDNWVRKYKCGLIVPISGFAHSVSSSTLDYKHDGIITGVGANIFKLAGSVILAAIISGFVFGILRVIIYV